MDNTVKTTPLTSGQTLGQLRDVHRAANSTNVICERVGISRAARNTSLAGHMRAYSQSTALIVMTEHLNISMEKKGGVQ